MTRDQRPVIVLVVDDEPLIRMNAADFLEDCGFVAIEADNGEHALEQLDAHPEIKVLFTDINMPGAFDGLDLARKVYARRPDIQLIITSGKMRPSEDEIPDHGKFFPKPYNGRAVAQLIEATQHSH
jgi:CheY-like chemotaxis protein